MIEAIGQYGPGMKAPIYHEVREPLLKNEVKSTRETMNDHEEEWEKNGCSLMADGWKDKRERTLINFLINCPKGSMFIKSVDASANSKTGEKVFQLLVTFVEEIVVSKVVQVVTDSAGANVLAGKGYFLQPSSLELIVLIYSDQNNLFQGLIFSLLIGKFLEAKYPHLYWTPRAAH